jgi:uncharacterized Zn-binding protein involved in type VI secretion
MGLGAARIGDATIGNCSHDDHDDSNPWNGIIIGGSSNVFSEGPGNAFITCTVLSDCGHTGIIISGSSSVFINGLGAATITSSFTGNPYYSGYVVGGAGSVFIG